MRYQWLNMRYQWLACFDVVDVLCYSLSPAQIFSYEPQPHKHATPRHPVNNTPLVARRCVRHRLSTRRENTRGNNDEGEEQGQDDTSADQSARPTDS